MKLSAPPPPPPPPSDGTPDENSPGTPDEQPNANPLGTPVADAPGSPQTGPKPVTWPAWYSGIDAALVGLVLVFAFVASSFVARNTDLWIHLAAGKRMFAGEYFPGGSDPFSYSAEGRTWVNHSWLTDAAAYVLYGGTGQVLVGAKALVVALAFGLLVAIRRPQFSLWPWAACACVGVLAAAPQFTLRPHVVSILLLAVTLYILFRMPQKKDSWRFPGAIGITFWVWANCDQWFFMGPLALVLLILGNLIQKYGFNTPDEPEDAANTEPLGRLPSAEMLAKALGIGILACTLTPHHVRIWELPFELTGANGIGADPRLRQILIAPHDSIYLNNASLGYNVNGLAYVILFVVGAVILGPASFLGIGRVRIAHVALWLGFGVLSLLSVFAIPFFAIVAVPLVASQLNAFGARAELKTLGDPRTRLLLIGSSGGRVLSVLAVCLLCVLAYPGWVHPDVAKPEYARRVVWAVEPDPALVQTAEQFQQWRDADALPPDARGFVTNTDLANYMAWHAPKEKVFVNARFRHHRRELADYVAVRRGLGLIQVQDEPPNPRDAAEVLTRRGAEYVVVNVGSADGTTLRLYAQTTTQSLYLRWGEWSVWHADGRTTVFGWRPANESGKPSFAKLRLDPVAKAFGPGVKVTIDPVVQQPLAQPQTNLDQALDAFRRATRPAPPGAAEAIGWLEYKQGLLARQQVRQQLSAMVFFQPPSTHDSLHWFAVFGADVNGTLRFPARPKQPAPGEAEEDFVAARRAIPLLALRAARAAIAKDPDHLDAYYALAQSLRDPDLPLTESERALGIVTALRQCLERFPPPGRYKRGQFAIFATQVALELANVYLGQRATWRDPVTKREMASHIGFPIDIPGLWELLGSTVLETRQGTIERVPTAAVRGRPISPDVRPFANGTPFFLPIDLARKTLQRALEYAPADLAGEGGEAARTIVKNVEDQLKNLENEEIRYRDRFEARKARAPKVPDVVQNAIDNCMIGEALNILNSTDTDLAKEYGRDEALGALRRVALELAAGRIENADELLGEKGLGDSKSSMAIERSGQAPLAQVLKYQKAVLAGEYRAAGELLAGLDGRALGLDALLANVAKTKIDPNKMFLAELGKMPPPVPGGGMLPSFLAFRFLFEHYRVALTIREEIAGKMQQDAQFFSRRGDLSLLQGDIPAAKEWFKQTRREPPAGWRLAAITTQNAENYLKLIERAAK